jgi:hypothetical protein
VVGEGTVIFLPGGERGRRGDATVRESTVERDSREEIRRRDKMDLHIFVPIGA